MVSLLCAVPSVWDTLPSPTAEAAKPPVFSKSGPNSAWCHGTYRCLCPHWSSIPWEIINTSPRSPSPRLSVWPLNIAINRNRVSL